MHGDGIFFWVHKDSNQIGEFGSWEHEPRRRIGPAFPKIGHTS